MSKRLITTLLLGAAALCAQAANPTHLYLLNDASDALGGPALTGYGGSFGTSAYGQSGYSFGANLGLSLEAAVPQSVYTIDFTMALDETTGYRRLVDFKNLTSDTGLYNLNTSLNFYNLTTSPGGAFAAGQLARVTITRDAAGTFTGYVNGLQQISFTDSSGLGEFTGPSQIAYFFRDDNAVSNEASGGFVDYIRIYDVALNATEVAGLTNPVPEPGTWALMLGGLALLGSAARRR